MLSVLCYDGRLICVSLSGCLGKNTLISLINFCSTCTDLGWKVRFRNITTISKKPFKKYSLGGPKPTESEYRCDNEAVGTNSRNTLLYLRTVKVHFSGKTGPWLIYLVIKEFTWCNSVTDKIKRNLNWLKNGCIVKFYYLPVSRPEAVRVTSDASLFVPSSPPGNLFIGYEISTNII